MFADAAGYPVRAGAWAMILTGAIFSVLLDVARMVPVIGLPATIFGAGFFASFYLDVVSTTMLGEDRAPDWPSVSEFLDDIVMPFLRIVGLVLISFGPAAAAGIVMDDRAEAYRWTVGGLVAAGALYFPMAVLGSMMCGNLFGALPHIVLPAVARALPGYLLAVVGLAVAVAAGVAAEEFGGRVPFVGWFLATAISIYALMMQARVIGLIYREKREHLGWE